MSENGNQNSIVKDNTQNIIPIQKNSNSPKKFPQVNKANSDKIHKMNKEPKQNKNINNQLNNNKKSKEINSTKDKISKEIKNNDMDEQRMNMKPQKIKIDKKLKKLNIENEDGPMDNNRKKYYKNMEEIKEMGNDIMNLNANLDTVHLDNERRNKEIEKYKAHIMFLTETNQKLINELEAVIERDNQLKMILSQTDEIPDFLNKTRNDIDNALNNLEIGLTSQK